MNNQMNLMLTVTSFGVIVCFPLASELTPAVNSVQLNLGDFSYAA